MLEGVPGGRMGVSARHFRRDWVARCQPVRVCRFQALPRA